MIDQYLIKSDYWSVCSIYMILASPLSWLLLAGNYASYKLVGYNILKCK